MTAWWVALAWAAPLDLNAADAEALDRLVGVGPSLAEAIVSWRDARGACADPRELLEVPGLGEATWRAIRPFVRCGAGPLPAAVVPVRGVPPTRSPVVVDINRADEAALQLLAGMTPERAARLVADRDANGPYSRCLDVTRVAGFGPATITAWGSRCTVGDSAE